MPPATGKGFVTQNVRNSYGKVSLTTAGKQLAKHTQFGARTGGQVEQGNYVFEFQ